MRDGHLMSDQDVISSKTSAQIVVAERFLRRRASSIGGGREEKATTAGAASPPPPPLELLYGVPKLVYLPERPRKFLSQPGENFGPVRFEDYRRSPPELQPYRANRADRAQRLCRRSIEARGHHRHRPRVPVSRPTGRRCPDARGCGCRPDGGLAPAEPQDVVRGEHQFAPDHPFSSTSASSDGRQRRKSGLWTKRLILPNEVTAPVERDACLQHVVVGRLAPSQG